MAAATVRMLSPLIESFVCANPGDKLPPPYGIRMKPLQVYTFLRVTGRVLARTVHPLQIVPPTRPSVAS